MYTHIHTTEWIYNPAVSEENTNYFYNRIDGRILCELKTKKGNEYYFCSDEQVRAKTTGIYIGCVKQTDKRFPNILVYDHDKEAERTVSLNDEQYL